MNASSDALKAARQGSVLFALSLASNVLSFGAQIVFGRLLQPAEYGSLGALLALLQALIVPFSVLQMLMAAAYANDSTAEPGRDAVGRSLPWLGVIAGLLLLSAPVGSGIARDALHLPSSTSVVLVIVIAVLNLFMASLRGICQGRQQFLWLGISFLIEFGGRVALGGVLTWRWPASEPALVGILISSILALGWLVVPLWRDFRRVSLPSRAVALITLAFVRSVITGWAVTWDMVWAQSHVPQLAGYYTAASMSFRVQTALAGVIGMVLFPRLERSCATGEGERSNLLLLGGLTGVAGLLAGCGMYVVAPWVVPLLFGRVYAASVGWFQTLSFATLPLVWATVVTHFDVAARNWSRTALLAVAAGAYAFGLFTWVSTLAQLMAWMGLIWGAFLVLWVVALPSGILVRPAAGAAGAQAHPAEDQLSAD